MKSKHDLCYTACVYLQDAKITFSTLPEFFSFSTDSQSSTKKKNMLSVCMSQTITCFRNQDGSRPGKHSNCLWGFVILERKKEGYSKPLTCVVMPDAYFPDLSEIGICFNLEVIQAVPLESSFSLKVTWATFIQAIQANANMCSGTWWIQIFFITWKDHIYWGWWIFLACKLKVIFTRSFSPAVLTRTRYW